MIYFFKKVIHFFTSNSRHGTHSPFVYALTEELIYNNAVKRSASLIEDIIAYYDKKGIDRGYFLIIESGMHTEEELAVLQNAYFMIFLLDIHKNKKSENKWIRMKANEEFIVLIDLFEFGIICKRKEQPKENFKLRFPYWLY